MLAHAWSSQGAVSLSVNGQAGFHSRPESLPHGSQLPRGEHTFHMWAALSFRPEELAMGRPCLQVLLAAPGRPGHSGAATQLPAQLPSWRVDFYTRDSQQFSLCQGFNLPQRMLKS